ncbi:MAG TPA: hypothetical protein VM432_04425 [Bdellovibrionales bacterium]|nr:hypothetical protein [Bdellovibrionales bacterium]
MQQSLFSFLLLGMRNRFLLVLLSTFVATLAGCAAGESAGSGDLVSIPKIRIDCTTAGCMAANSTLKIIAFITASGCDAPGFGALRSTSLNMNCAAGVGCSGFLSNWIDTATSARTDDIPDGTYSTCVIVDLDNNYAGEDSATPGDAYGTLDDIAVTEDTGTQFVTAFTDL